MLIASGGAFAFLVSVPCCATVRANGTQGSNFCWKIFYKGGDLRFWDNSIRQQHNLVLEHLHHASGDVEISGSVL